MTLSCQFDGAFHNESVRRGPGPAGLFNSPRSARGLVSRPTLISGALILQAVGIALPALSDGPAAGTASAMLFGATFMAVTTLSLATGSHLGIRSAVPLLTAGYATGQILGPIVVAPLLSSGYRPALLVGGAIVLAAGTGSALMRIRFPHHDQPHHAACRARRRGCTPATPEEPSTSAVSVG